MLANNSYEKLVSFRPFTKKLIFSLLCGWVCVYKNMKQWFFVVVKDFAFSMSIMWREGGGEEKVEEGCGQDVTTICSFNETYNNLQIKREQGGVSKVLYVCLFFCFCNIFNDWLFCFDCYLALGVFFVTLLTSKLFLLDTLNMNCVIDFFTIMFVCVWGVGRFLNYKL